MTKDIIIFIILKVCDTMKLNLFDVFTSKGKVRTEELTYEPDIFTVSQMTYPIIEKSPVRIILENIKNGKVRLKGSFEFVLEVPCDRCLSPVNERILCEFDQELLSNEKKASTDEDYDDSFMHDMEFDIEEFVNMYVLMNMPSKVLCHEDCKGLCLVCGHNLNESDCGCDSFVPDPRMAEIADIFYASKEV